MFFCLAYAYSMNTVPLKKGHTKHSTPNKNHIVKGQGLVFVLILLVLSLLLLLLLLDVVCIWFSVRVWSKSVRSIFFLFHFIGEYQRIAFFCI